jgi:murein DD-endopeptidase MepM/ murein hydrolase activator NlpD
MRALRRLAVVSLLAAAVAHAGPPAPAAPPATLADAEKELTVIDRRLAEIEGKAGKLTTDITLRDRRSIARARAYARLARAGLLPVAGGFDTLVEHMMKIEGARRAILNDLGSLKGLRQEHRDIVATRDGLAARRAVVVAQRDALAQAQSMMEEAEDRKRAFERAFESSTAGSSHVAVYGAGITVREPEAVSSAGFAALRGKLPFPVAGRAEVRSARRESAAGPGVELKAPGGSAVRVVSAGRVAFSARHGDYGRIVIVDHGDRWFSVYGNLGSVDVKTGDDLTGGSRIGSVGDEGQGAMLYFELRHGSETVDPKPWLGLLVSWWAFVRMSLRPGLATGCTTFRGLRPLGPPGKPERSLPPTRVSRGVGATRGASASICVFTRRPEIASFSMAYRAPAPAAPIETLVGSIVRRARFVVTGAGVGLLAWLVVSWVFVVASMLRRVGCVTRGRPRSRWKRHARFSCDGTCRGRWWRSSSSGQRSCSLPVDRSVRRCLARSGSPPGASPCSRAISRSTQCRRPRGGGARPRVAAIIGALRAFALLALPLSGVVVLTHGCAAEPVPIASPPVPAVSVEVASRPSDECLAASALVSAAERALAPVDGRRPPASADRCAARWATEAARRCESVRAQALDLFAIADERSRAAPNLTLSVTPDARWVLQGDDKGHARIWEWVAGAPKLAMRLEADMTWDARAGGLVIGRREGAAILVDARSGKTARFDDVSALGVLEGGIMLAGAESVRRVDRTTFEVTGTATSSAKLDVGYDGPFVLLRGGRSVMVGGALVSFDRHAVLARGVQLVSRSEGDQRLLVCDDRRHALVLEGETGRREADVDLSATSSCGFSMPGLSPDGRFLVGVDDRASARGVRQMEVVVVEIATGKTTRRLDPSMSFSTALDASVSIEKGTVCVGYGNMHWRRFHCPWSIDSGGRISPRRAPAHPASPRFGIVGAEMARATSADGRFVVVATYDDLAKRPNDPPDQARLRATVVDVASGRPLREVVVAPGKVSISWSTLAGASPASVRFLDATHALIFGGTDGSVPPVVLDVESGTFAVVPADAELVPDTRFATVGGALLDLPTGRVWSLVPDFAEWRGVATLDEPCAMVGG